MDREEYGKAVDRLVDRYLADKITVDTYFSRLEALKREFTQSQQEKSNANRSVERAGTEAGG